MSAAYAGVDAGVALQPCTSHANGDVPADKQSVDSARQHQIIMLCIPQAALDAELRRLEA